MDLRQKLYQMFILGLDGGEYEYALSLGLGGVIFFTKDILSKNKFCELIKYIKSKSLIQPFLSIDQEGGRVERTENIHNGKKYLSAKYAFEKGTDFLRNQTEEISSELKEYGLNLNFAPCIDVNTNPKNPIIGERSFSDNPDDVIKCEKIVSQVYRENGIIPCVKHFPGHGDADKDSHLTLPVIDLPLSEMEAIHIKPFKACAKTIEMVMIGHLYCTCFETNFVPASLSANTIRYLRDNLGFKGITISDDMMMKGVSDGIEAFEAGIRAGLNMFICRKSDKEIIDIIENIAQKALKDEEIKENIEKSFEKIMALKAEKNIITNSSV